MTIALQRNEDGADTIFFDAVLAYSNSYQSKLTAHPIDGKSKDGIYVVNDHVITENPTFQLKGVISGCDFNTGRPTNSEYNFVNDNSLSSGVQVRSTGDSLLEKTVGSLYPFGKSVEPVIEMADRSSDNSLQIKALLIDISSKRELVTLVEFTNGKPTTTQIDLVITSLQFSEDVESGDSINVDLTLQRANFVDLVLVKTGMVNPSNTSGAIRDKAQGFDIKGAQAGKENKYLIEVAEGSSSIGVLKSDSSLKSVTKILQSDGGELPIPKDKTSLQQLLDATSDLVNGFSGQDGQSYNNSVKLIKSAGMLPTN